MSKLTFYPNGPAVIEMIELTDEIYKWVVKFAKKEI